MFSVIPNHTAAGQIDRKQVSFTGKEKRKWKVSVAKVFPETGCKVTAVGRGGNDDMTYKKWLEEDSVILR